MLTLTAKATLASGRLINARGDFGPAGGGIGRDRANALVLPDPQRTLPRTLARVACIEGRYILQNVSPAHPILANGSELATDHAVALADGDELRVGEFVIKVGLRAAQVFPCGEDHTGVSADPTLPVEDSLAVVDPMLILSGAISAGKDGMNPFADLMSDSLLSAHSLAGVDSAGGNSESGIEPANALDRAEGEPAAAMPAIATASLETLNSDINDPLADEQSRREATLPASSEPALTQGLEACVEHVQEYLPATSTPLADGIQKRQRAELVGQAAPGWSSVTGAEHAQSVPESRSASQETPLMGLAGDPFADLMAVPVQEHLARVETSRVHGARGDLIPDDFNPLASGGVAGRNSADPLTPLSFGSGGIADVLPEATLDSLFNPGVESPTDLLQSDPLNQSNPRSLSVGQEVDPLRLFEGDADDGWMLGQEHLHDAVMSNNASELEIRFRLPQVHTDAAMDNPKQSASTAALELSLNNLDVPVLETSYLPQASSVAERSSAMAIGDNNTQELTHNEGRLMAEPCKHSGAWLASSDGAAEGWLAAFERGAGLDQGGMSSLTVARADALGRLLKAGADAVAGLLVARAARLAELPQQVRLEQMAVLDLLSHCEDSGIDPGAVLHSALESVPLAQTMSSQHET